MMKASKYAVALAIALAAPANAADYTIRPVAAEGSAITYDRGQPVVERQVGATRVVIVPLDEDRGRPAFAVYVENHGETAFDFGTESIIASVADERRPTVVYTHAELEDQAQDRAVFHGILAGLAGAAAGYSGSSWRTPYGTYRSSYYNGGAAMATGAILGNAVARGLSDRLAQLSSNVLQTTTVAPGDAYGGMIVLSRPRAREWPATLTLTVSVGTDASAFVFQIDR